jgi:fructose-1,6-bisphosphatase I
MYDPLTNLNFHLQEQLETNPKMARELTEILGQISFGSKMIAREVNKAGLANILGKTGAVNVQGEEVQKLDEFANSILVRLLHNTHEVVAVGSEELADIHVYESDLKNGQYVVLIDPLDGSSNIDVNVSIGTIFTIFRRVGKKGSAISKKDYLQSGRNIVCAGYVLYGSSTMLLYSVGSGLHGFTLDPTIGEFLLSHEFMAAPETGSVYSVNESYAPQWPKGIRRYLDLVKTDRDVSGQAKGARYIGSLVADFHRNLLKGGIYLYPADENQPEGKLRLLFEAAPLAFLIEQAGGAASNGQKPILDLVPEHLHQRTPLFIGSKDDVAVIRRLLSG